ncbi:hypothetical protein ENBRE01_3341 [Enteropsectra breve]|nr:hypothetical protein ENBRE01_3341 [Enteropsectra breve]
MTLSEVSIVGVSNLRDITELIAIANEAPSHSDQDICLIFGALKNPCFVKNVIFEPLDIMRRSSGAPGYAMMQAAPKAAGHETNYDSSYQVDQTRVSPNRTRWHPCDHEESSAKRPRIQEPNMENVNAEIDRVSWFNRDRETMTVIDHKLTETVSA